MPPTSQALRVSCALLHAESHGARGCPYWCSYCCEVCVAPRSLLNFAQAVPSAMSAIEQEPVSRKLSVYPAQVGLSAQQLIEPTFMWKGIPLHALRLFLPVPLISGPLSDMGFYAMPVMRLASPSLYQPPSLSWSEHNAYDDHAQALSLSNMLAVSSKFG